jgi:hypothetical protein
LKAKGCSLAGALACEPALASDGILCKVEVEEGFSLDNVLQVLAELEENALGERIHGR